MSEGLHVKVKHRFGDFLLDVDFEGSAGVTVLFGPSGSGKSLTLACVGGAFRPKTGYIRQGDQVLFDNRHGVDVPIEHRRVGWVFQDARLFPHLTVEQNLLYGLRRFRGRAASFRFEEVTAVLGVERLLSRRPQDLSGGEAQRVAVGRALLSQPQLLLMDEPLSALHAERKDDVVAYLQTVRDTFAVPILYVTHSMSEALRLADRVVVLEDGRIKAQGPLPDVLARQELSSLHERTDVGVAVAGVVSCYDPSSRSATIRAGGADWICTRVDRPPAADVRLIVLAKDVMLSTVRPSELSAENVLSATVLFVGLDGENEAVVRLDVAGREVLSQIARISVQTLDLAPGRSVWAIIRATALEGGGAAPVLSSGRPTKSLT